MLTTEQVNEQAGVLLQPISPAEPAGANASLDERYEKLRDEVAKLDAMAGAKVDWKFVESTGRALLTTTTKDLLVASYTAYAMLELDGFAGLATGLAMVRGHVENYWDQLFPPRKRVRGRVNAIEWLTARAEAKVAAMPAQPADIPILQVLQAEAKALTSACRDKFGDQLPSTTGVNTAIERHLASHPDSPPSAAAAPAPAAPAAPAPAEPPPAPAPAPVPVPAPAPSVAPTPTETKPDTAAEMAADAEPWLAPIRPDAPTGDDARYEDSYDAVRTQIDALNSPTLAPSIRWDKVADDAGHLVKTQSKDLLIACYFAYATTRAKGLGGVGVGLAVVTELMKRYWDGLHPKRTRARVNALDWLVGHLESHLQTVQPSAGDRAAVDKFERYAKVLHETNKDKFDADGPASRPLVDRAERLRLNVPQPAANKPAVPAPAPAPGAPDAPAPSAAAPAPAAAPAAPRPTGAPVDVPDVAAPAEVTDDASVTRFLRQSGQSLERLSKGLRTDNPGSVLAYRLNRLGSWLPVQAAPEAENGKTSLMQPRAKAQIQALVDKDDWAAVLRVSEASVPANRFWLDLHRLAATAMQRLGPDYEPARKMLISEVAAFLMRFPEVPDLSFRDGTPMADEATKAWLKEEVLVSKGGGGGDGEATDEETAQVLSELKQLLADGKADDAMAKARDAFERAPTERKRFARRLGFAEICLAGGQAKLARGLLTQLDRELTDRGLFEWEPEMAARCLGALVRAIRETTRGRDVDPEAIRAAQRLTAIDPAAAVKYL